MESKKKKKMQGLPINVDIYEYNLWNVTNVNNTLSLFIALRDSLISLTLNPQKKIHDAGGGGGGF